MMAKTFALKINNCTECPHHRVLPDPDPTDWFCDDDVKVKCTRSSAKDYGGFYCKEPYITVACRPYNTEKECEVPPWCPLKE